MLLVLLMRLVLMLLIVLVSGLLRIQPLSVGVALANTSDAYANVRPRLLRLSRAGSGSRSRRPWLEQGRVLDELLRNTVRVVVRRAIVLVLGVGVIVVRSWRWWVSQSGTLAGAGLRLTGSLGRGVLLGCLCV